METFLTIVHVFVAVFMILVVLVQGGNQGGMGAAFGGGNTQGVFGAQGATSFLGKLTYVAAFIFMITTLSLTVLQGGGRDVGLKSQLEKATNEKALQEKPAESAAAPAEEAPKPEAAAATPVQTESTPAEQKAPEAPAPAQ